MDLYIKSSTTGFASPAEAYVDKRLDLNDLICPNTHSTFYFRYEGPDFLGLRKGNVVVIDRSIEAKTNELIVTYDHEGFHISKYDGISEYWGRISWVLKQQ